MARTKRVPKPAEPAQPHSRSSNWVQWAALLIAAGTWLQPQLKNDSDKLLDAKIDSRIKDELKQNGLSDVSSKLMGLSEKVEALNDFVKILANAELNKASQLKHGELKRELPRVDAAMSAAVVAETKIPQPVLSSLSKAIGAVAKTTPEDAAVWKVASQLINYQVGETQWRPRTTTDTQGRPLNSQYCLEQHMLSQYRFVVPNIPPSRPAAALFGFTLHDCILVLDDRQTFERSEFGQYVVSRMNEVMHQWPQADLVPVVNLLLENVLVIYRGGDPVPFQNIAFQNCFFRYEPQLAIPSLNGQKYITQLLASDDRKNLTIKLSGLPS